MGSHMSAMGNAVLRCCEFDARHWLIVSTADEVNEVTLDWIRGIKLSSGVSRNECLN